jgi:LytS/YehU family sensor histidine kinase
MFVIIPMLIFRLDDFHRSDELVHFLQVAITNLLVFYLTYFILIPRLMKKRRLLDLVWIGLFWILAISAVRIGITYYYKEILTPLEGKPFIMERHLFREIFGTMMFTLYPVLIYFSIEWFKERQYRFELAREKQKSEIDLLKTQMNPHFLMNTLNNLYSLVYQGSALASDAVLKLSDIMRYMLYDTQADLVPLENEVKYLRSYIELQMLRFKNQDLVDFNISGELSDRKIAPVILIPFVENAFKHGNKNLPGMGISIDLAVDEEKMVFEVKNIKSHKEIQKDSGTGVGLANIKKRLELQYPGKHILEIDDAMDSFRVYLEIHDR